MNLTYCLCDGGLLVFWPSTVFLKAADVFRADGFGVGDGQGRAPLYVCSQGEGAGQLCDEIRMGFAFWDFLKYGPKRVCTRFSCFVHR